MSNRNYKRGADKERKIVKKLMPSKVFSDIKENGVIAFRSAGSHSPIDVISIDFKNKIIKVIQCKHCMALQGRIEPKLKIKLEKEWAPLLDGLYNLKFNAL